MQNLSIILSHIPTWVWAILAFIVVMGFIQSRDQRMSRQRLMILPLVWLAFGAWGVKNSFGLGLDTLAAWGVGLVLSLRLVKLSGWPGGARFDVETQRYFVPGSWLPLGLMLGIFVAKFALGMSLGFHPELASNSVFAISFSALFGTLSGVFLGRSRNILGRAPAPLTAAQA